MNTIRNPILRGFNPDPSICRVGQDYYIATSTFEWFPGVQIHHSRDLATWRLAARPLQRPDQLDMRGDPDSCGVWAPDISHVDGRFHLLFTDVKRYGMTTTGETCSASLRDFRNYVVTAETVEGPWSAAVHLNGSGFDPSLFHDDEGRSWMLNMLWDHRPGRNRFAGIVIQEYDRSALRLIGERRLIFKGTRLGLTEGPHLYRHGGWYYLLVAEGGTGWNHAVTVARSRSLFGPYEVDPQGVVLTSHDRKHARLQRAGHADLVETPDGETWMAYLCGRPLPARGRCILGRETAIQRVRWTDDGWLRTEAEDASPLDEVPAPALPATEQVTEASDDMFGGDRLAACFQWLRTPYPERLFSLAARPGYLRLFGRDSVGSQFEQSLVARRQQAFRIEATTRLEFEPDNFQQAAGLICYYNSHKFHYLHVTTDDEAGRHLRVMSAVPDESRKDAFTAPVPIPAGPIELRAAISFDTLRFAFKVDGAGDWQWLGEEFDASILSDEATVPGLPNFTGNFIGLACQDMSGASQPADFAFFRYREEACVAPTMP
jgi:xylan 1,4-beta-xylosidase